MSIGALFFNNVLIVTQKNPTWSTGGFFKQELERNTTLAVFLSEVSIEIQTLGALKSPTKGNLMNIQDEISSSME